MIKTSIITIGDELLIGQVIDTNSAWMAQELNKAGIAVLRRVAVGDTRDAIWNALDEESRHADIILITGGLGPTADDITKPLLTEYFGGNLIVDEGALRNLQYLFETVFKRPLTERNLKQAEVPDNCKVLLNKRGTAPGMLFEKNGIVYVSMPGVPHEMQGMMTDDVIPYIRRSFPLPFIAHRTLLTYGIGESYLADMIQDIEEALPSYIKLAYLPNYGMVRLRLTASGEAKDEIEKVLDERFEALQERVKDFLVINEDAQMQEVIAKILLESKQTMCTAESCTGGYIAHLLTSIAGSSAFYDGSVVSYSYKAKEDLLQVKESTLLDKGAVSEEVVYEMAKGALKNIGSHYAIAVSGIMGPGGGMPDKPVGTVWICVGDKNKLAAKKFHFRFDRTRNIQLTAVNALNMLREFILNG
ncbi:competence/damage-inducible protein A [Ferruginibacter sp. HRS2-29]|uniref:competence/damage-inducible protein A n=2 Tax=Ferruginibacter sp. HRS2-29 TaxID=2487334 RepID=UPI0020CD517B|nr:competence/damage-inducible protein A [Ferruginibacter sp. HRS2-29]MCP9751402.1 competence/damage-inducible protein A [Ferruginibacter sp. HRS2-29]